MKYQVMFYRTDNLYIDVEADSPDEANDKADEILCSYTPEQIEDKISVGLWEMDCADELAEDEDESNTTTN